MARERNESGRYVETVGPDEVLGTFDAVDGPVITSTDVAEYLECTTEAARQKLKRLVEEETLARRRTGRTFIYWRTPEAADAESGRETGEMPSEVSDDQRVGQAAGGRTSPERAAEGSDETDTLITDLRAHLDAVDATPKTEHGRDALVDVVRHLREHGTMKTAELKKALYAEYGEHYGSDRAMWESIRRYLEDTPGVDTDAGYGKYGYDGDDAVREALEV